MLFVRFTNALAGMLLWLLINAGGASAKENNLITTLESLPSTLISGRVQEKHVFYGLASYYNNVSYYILDKYELRGIAVGERITLQPAQWLAAVGIVDTSRRTFATVERGGSCFRQSWNSEKV